MFVEQIGAPLPAPSPAPAGTGGIRVTDLNNAPLVALMNAANAGLNLWGSSDASTGVGLAGLADGNYFVTISKDGYAGSSFNLVVSGGAYSVTWARLGSAAPPPPPPPPPPVQFTVTVYANDWGTPLNLATVWLYNGPTPVSAIVTGPDGTATFRLPAGTGFDNVTASAQYFGTVNVPVSGSSASFVLKNQ